MQDDHHACVGLFQGNVDPRLQVPVQMQCKMQTQNANAKYKKEYSGFLLFNRDMG